jgi:hypothetical protein
VAEAQATSPEQLLADAARRCAAGDRAARSTPGPGRDRSPFDPHVKMQKALIHRMSGALPAALAALDEALALDPYNFLALLSKAAVVRSSPASGWPPGSMRTPSSWPRPTTTCRRT